MMKFKRVKLLSNDLESLKHFYTQNLQHPLFEEKENSFSVQFGRSILEFEYTNSYENPLYHYAVNIPENQFEKGLEWLRARTKLLLFQGSPIIDFVNWNAHSCYFQDPAGNIGELIARHNLNNASDEAFGATSWLSISEIGMPHPELDSLHHFLQNSFDLPLFKAHHQHFRPLGGDEALFICVPQGRNWFPLEIPAGLFPIWLNFEKPIAKELSFGVYHFT